MTPAVRLCLFSCLLAHLFSIVPLARADPQANLPLTPVFFNTQGQTAETIKRANSPQFCYTITNTTHKNIDVAGMLDTAAVILDGKEYHQSLVSFLGNPVVSPGQTWTSTFYVRAFLPGSWKPSGWTWNDTALAEGSHTLAYKMGGKTYGPAAFIWHSPNARISSLSLPTLALAPVFFNTEGQTPEMINSLNSPRFACAVTNTTHKNIELMRDYFSSTIMLDGKEHSRSMTIWIGNDKLRPGDTWTSYQRISGYLAEYEKAGNKWNDTVLAGGSHTLTYKIGGKTYGPIAFIWHSQATP